MKIKLIPLAISSILISSLNIGYALPPAGGEAPSASVPGGYSSSGQLPPAGGEAPTPPSSGYSSSGQLPPAGGNPPGPGVPPSPPAPAGGGYPPSAPGYPPTPPATPATAPGKVHGHKDKNHLRFNFSVPTQNGSIVFSNDRHRPHRAPIWVGMPMGNPFPPQALVGGQERNRPLYICQARFQGSLFPGKIVNRDCHITYGGDEISVSTYQVLVSSSPLAWVPASNGAIPGNAFAAGYEHGRPLFVCQARYHGNLIPGKVVGPGCNIAWNGREISMPFYNVLVG